MVHTNTSGSYIQSPYQEIKKGKDDRMISGQRMQQQQQPQRSTTTTTTKSEKYGAWGPIYKNKENFINMHIC